MIHTLFIFIPLLVKPMLNDVQIPNKWTPEFKIQLSHTGSMSGSSTEIQYTFDECRYKYSSDSGEPVEYTFKMTDAWRVEILEKMRSMKVDKIKSRGGTYAVKDGWSQSICLGTTCIEGGPSAEISRGDKNTFLEAFNYLQQFALDRKP